MPARVASVYATRADVWTPDGERHALVRSRTLRDAASVGGLAVGDWVGVAAIPGDEDLVVEALLPRRTAFLRQAAGERSEPQVIAANIDRVFVVTAVDGDFNSRRLERYLTAIAGGGAEGRIILSKADLAGDSAEMIAHASALVDTILASARTGLGVETLRAAIPVGTTAALVGSSGVGKSALVNALLGRSAQTEGEVREHDRRGRHTTTRRELFVVPRGGLLVDTPGLRELKPWQPEAQTTSTAFEDIARIGLTCKYRDCRHEREPGCAIRSALDDGSLSHAHLDSWRKLEDERAQRSARQAAFREIEAKRKARAGSVALRKRLKAKGR